MTWPVCEVCLTLATQESKHIFPGFSILLKHAKCEQSLILCHMLESTDQTDNKFRELLLVLISITAKKYSFYFVALATVDVFSMYWHRTGT